MTGMPSHTLNHKLAIDGFVVFPCDPAVVAWSTAAADAAFAVIAAGGERRHGGTWFVGVDALPNAKNGAINGVPLGGAWLDHVTVPRQWHAAQLSVVFPGYPRQVPGESDAAHRFRRDRDAAHVDGLIPEGPGKRRYLREPHAFIAGLPLNDVTASPLVVWLGSHQVMRAAFRRAYAGHAPDEWPNLDVTDVYQAARASVFEECARVEVRAKPGQVMLLDRHMVHGVAPWGDSAETRPRMVAYFRPLTSFRDWL